ncbi:hypothetical protein BSG1_19130 [Bacillus sp. SG-1]|nr:hypothetical protein BSG1_19130 [Bacillus sp. SG-1]
MLFNITKKIAFIHRKSSGKQERKNLLARPVGMDFAGHVWACKEVNGPVRTEYGVYWSENGVNGTMSLDYGRGVGTKRE